MLRYVGSGTRHYGEHPMPPHPRLNWEFLAVISGKISPFERNDPPLTPVESTFWMFPPGVVHGWAGERDKPCELIVIHYSTVPETVAHLAGKHGHLKVKLRPRDIAKLRSIAQQLKRYYWHPTLEGDLHAQRALMDMCLLVARDYRERRQQPLSRGAYSRVLAAEEWMREHLAENPSIEAVAKFAKLSLSQLYRLFLKVRGESPQKALNRIRIDRAIYLLGRTNGKLQTIAADSGFKTASDLCRAFKAAKGCSPTAWRRETFIKYKMAAKATDPADHTRFGRRSRPVN